MSYDDTQARIAEGRSQAAAARAARDESEIAELADMLIEHEEYREVRVPQARPDLPGHVILRPPTKVEASKFRTILWSEKSTAEMKSKAGLDMAASCVVYPSRERYQALIEAFPMVADQCSLAVKEAAEGGSQREVKK